MGYLSDIKNYKEVAQLQGTYAAMWMDEEDANTLYDYLQKAGIPNLEPADKYHVTTTYSRVPMAIPDHDLRVNLDPEKYDYKIFNSGDRKILVLAVKHPMLNKLWQEGIDAGCSWDHDEYIPHITLSNDVGEDNAIVDNLPAKPPFALQLDRYKVEDLKD